MGRKTLSREIKFLLASLLGNAAVMLLFRFCMTPVFETNDDMAIMGIVNGTRGSMDIHVIQHFLLGYLYKGLYQITSSVSWYSVCQYLFLMLGFTAVVYVVLKRTGKESGTGIALVIAAFFAPQCYGMMQYTKAAGILTCSGIFLIFDGLDRKNTAVPGEGGSPAGHLPGFLREYGWGEMLCGFLLALIGSMYRFDEFLSAAAVMSGIGFWLLMMLAGEKKAFIFKRGLSYLTVFGLLFLSAFVLHRADTALYENDERWSYYKEYNDLRAQLQDYGFPDYDENREAYDALGIDRDAYDLYSGWNQFDPDKLDVSTMRSLIALKESRKVDLQLVKDFLRDVPDFLLNNRMCVCFLIMLTLLIVAVISSGRARNLRVWIALVWELGLFILLYFYLYYKGRYSMDRIAVGYWFALILFCIWITGEYPEVFRGTGIRTGLVLGAAAFGFYSSYWIDALPVNRADILLRREGGRNALTKLSEDKEHLYLRKAGLLVMDECFGPFDAQPESFLDNQGLLGGWICSVPVQLDVLEKYGVTNPYRDMIDNEKVLLVDNHIKTTLRYLRTYYNKNAQAVEVDSFGPAKVYRIVSDDGSSAEGM